MDLYGNTKSQHHACENHPVGQAMTSGSISAAAWADWLWAMRVIHLVVDPWVPTHMIRDRAFCADLESLPAAVPSAAALKFSADIVGAECFGAAYVLHGAHQSGGRVIAPKMAKRGLPTAHTCYQRPDQARAWVKEARGWSEFTEQAKEAFRCLLAVMDEIHDRSRERREATG